MSEISEKIRYVLQFYYKNGKNAAQARKYICDVYGQEALSNATARRWFARFRSGNFDVKDAPRSGRPITAKADEIMQMVKEDRQISSRDIAKELSIDRKTALNHLRKAGYTKKFDAWVPDELLGEHSKRPLSAYMLWLNEHREQIIKDNPGSKVTDIANRSSELWRGMEDKSEWEHKASKMKEEYNKAIKEYESDASKKRKTKVANPAKKTKRKDTSEKDEEEECD